MRVAVNAWFWDNPDTGSGQYSRKLAEHLVAPDLETHLVAPAGLGFRASRFTGWSGAPSRGGSGRRSARRNLAKVWFEQVAFPCAGRRLGADISHVPYWAPPLCPSVATVVTIHDIIPLILPEYRGSLLVRLYTALVGRSTRRAALVLTDSECSKRDIVARLHLPPARVRVVYLAVDERYTPSCAPDDVGIRARLGLPSRYALYVGGFDVRKNLRAALTAYRLGGPALGRECPLVIAGHLPERDTSFTPSPRRLAHEMELEAGEVRFIGAVDERDKPALYRGAVALLFPSRYEGFGLPPLEALACGTPVVGSRASSVPEVVGEAGLLFDPDDAENMAGALLRLVRDPAARAELGERAAAQAARFSWRRTAQETLAAYRMAAAANP